ALPPSSRRTSGGRGSAALLSNLHPKESVHSSMTSPLDDNRSIAGEDNHRAAGSASPACLLRHYGADRRYLLDRAARDAGLAGPPPVHLDAFYVPPLKACRRKELLPIDGVLVRDWDPDNRSINPGVQLGMRVYAIEGIRFVRVRFAYHDRRHWGGLDFIAV